MKECQSESFVTSTKTQKNLFNPPPLLEAENYHCTALEFKTLICPYHGVCVHDARVDWSSGDCVCWWRCSGVFIPERGEGPGPRTEVGIMALSRIRVYVCVCVCVLEMRRPNSMMGYFNDGRGTVGEHGGFSAQNGCGVLWLSEEDCEIIDGRRIRI